MELLAAVYCRQTRYNDADKLFEELEQRMKKKRKSYQQGTNGWFFVKTLTCKRLRI